MEQVFVDTNLFLCHLTQDQPIHSPRATALFGRIERGELQGVIADVVIFETVYTLQHHYKQGKERIATHLLPLLDLPGIVLRHKRRFRQVFDMYIRLNISFADAYYAVLMKHMRVQKMVSFDAEFDRVTDIQRLDP